MSASPEFTCTTPPPELLLEPLITAPPIENQVKVLFHHGKKEEEEEEVAAEDKCRTPTSAESKLPSLASICPSVPRKKNRKLLKMRRWRLQRCWRKLWAEPPEIVEIEATVLEHLFGCPVSHHDCSRKRRPQ
ncbi:hypothetical protein ZIOFF_003637 [Zingiber officinale]|uniref:Uncharacterized protein n=1 Tax=Zingiber officinale TaxID=94328 RepID=A0A8J5I9V5_ZINOF|nr:hypothetical protein ZIOFF_003637 [Zingiber officinale]